MLWKCLVVLKSSALPSLVQLSFGFQQTQKLAVKSKGSLAPLLKMTNSFCSSRSALQKLPALPSCFTVYGRFLQNSSQLSSEQAEACSSKIYNAFLSSHPHHAQQDPKLHSLVISAAKAIMNQDSTKQIFLVCVQEIQWHLIPH